MTDLVSTPARLDLTIWTGRTDTVRVTWPDGTLPAGVWSAAVASGGHPDLDLAVTVDGDTLHIDIPDTTGEFAGVAAAWQLAVDGRPVIAGTFRVSDQPGPSTIDAAVQLVEQTVQVSLVGGLDESPVQSVQGQTGEVTLTAADVDADPAGAAQQVADDLGSHEGDDAAHGDPLGALGTHEGVTSAHGWQAGGSHITGPVTRWPGPIHTNHDARYFWVSDMTGDATWTPNGATRHAPANWQFPGGEATRVKWLWTPGDGWSHHTLRVGWTNAALGGTGNVVWRYYERIIEVNAGDPGGSMVETPALVATHVGAMPSAFNSNRYENFAEHVPASSSFHVVLSVLERHGDDPDDTASGTALVYIATSTRTTGS